MNTRTEVKVDTEENGESILSRLADLEMRIAFQEDAMQILSEQLAHQQSLSEQQQHMLQSVYRQLIELRTTSEDNVPQEMQEKPPHY